MKITFSKSENVAYYSQVRIGEVFKVDDVYYLQVYERGFPTAMPLNGADSLATSGGRGFSEDDKVDEIYHSVEINFS